MPPEEPTEAPVVKKRGRPKKVISQEEEPPVVKTRGRPKKVSFEPQEEDEKKPRGRPRKALKLSDPDLSWEQKQSLLKSFVDQPSTKISLEEILEGDDSGDEQQDPIKKSNISRKLYNLIPPEDRKRLNKQDLRDLKEIEALEEIA